MTAAWVLAAQTLRERLRDRSLQAAAVFAGVLLYMSLILGALAVDQELRVLLDFGLGFIELMALGMAAFSAATSLLQEIETKTIYLILTRPVPRWAFLAGRWLGLWLASACAVGAMCAMHLTLLLIKGWPFSAAYLLAAGGILLKLAVATALATLLALSTTSAQTALTITAIVWTLGHFIPEIRFLSGRSGAAGALLAGASRLLPNLQLLNYRDRLDVPGGALAAAPGWLGPAYAAAYAGLCLGAAYLFLRRKEL